MLSHCILFRDHSAVCCCFVDCGEVTRGMGLGGGDAYSHSLVWGKRAGRPFITTLMFSCWLMAVRSASRDHLNSPRNGAFMFQAPKLKGELGQMRIAHPCRLRWCRSCLVSCFSKVKILGLRYSTPECGKVAECIIVSLEHSVICRCTRTDTFQRSTIQHP